MMRRKLIQVYSDNSKLKYLLLILRYKGSIKVVSSHHVSSNFSVMLYLEVIVSSEINYFIEFPNPFKSWVGNFNTIIFLGR